MLKLASNSYSMTVLGSNVICVYNKTGVDLLKYRHVNSQTVSCIRKKMKFYDPECTRVTHQVRELLSFRSDKSFLSSDEVDLILDLICCE